MSQVTGFSRSLAAIALTAAAATVSAEELRIGAGGASGEYTGTVVPALSAALGKIDAEMSAVAVTGAGSQENLEKLTSGELDFALMQLDVLALNPSAEVELIELIAPEALLCAARVDGPIRSYHNLTDDRAEPMVISVGAEGSGSAVTMSYLLSLDPDFDVDNLAIINQANTEAELDRLAAGTRDLVCMVMLANPENPLIVKVDDNDELRFIDFIDAYALEATVGDTSVYDSAVVPVSKGLWGFRAEKVQTLTTWMALVAGPNASEEMKTALRDAAATPDLLPPTTASGKAKALYGQFKSKAKDYTARATDKAVELKDKAKAKALELTAVTKEKASELTDKAVELGTKAKDKAVELGGQAADKASELKQKATEAVQGSNN